MGLTFKEDCRDLRNTKVMDIVNELKNHSTQVDIYDPWANKSQAEFEYGILPIEQPQSGAYDGMVLAVAHKEFKLLSSNRIREPLKSTGILFDVKHLLPAKDADLRL